MDNSKTINVYILNNINHRLICIDRGNILAFLYVKIKNIIHSTPKEHMTRLII